MKNKLIKYTLYSFFIVLTIPVITSAMRINKLVKVQQKINNETTMKNTIIHRSETRNHADFGWLKVNHTFSFANYYNPERMNFGVLRVLNDDIIAGGKGFDMHFHDNMEIITIPLSGSLKHEDDMGNKGIISKGEIQVMSAGTGINHSEFNSDKVNDVNVLQIWVYTNKMNVEPRYQKKSLKELEKSNELFQILSPNKNNQGVWIYQNAWFSMGNFNKKIKTKYKLNDENNGVYIFIIEGTVNINNNQLSKRDGIGLWNIKSVEINAEMDSEILIMEIPMNKN